MITSERIGTHQREAAVENMMTFSCSCPWRSVDDDGNLDD
jgi:hypothetical protein